jgi:3-deoxy-7-phosphoheptulonate synthase
MSPESGKMHHNTVLEEAEYLRPHLLGIEKELRKSDEEKLEILLAGKRENLHYNEPEDFNSDELSDKRVSLEPVIRPLIISKFIPITKSSAETTRAGRAAFEMVFNQETDKLAVFLGPCSVHDAEQLKVYANYIKEWREVYGEDLEIFLRFYTEKPRTILKKGSEWKGYAYDPYLDQSDDINTGVIAMRLLACQITSEGIPLIVERLNPATSQYLDKLVSVDVIGARDASSQRAREYGQGTSSSILYKNRTDGDIQVAVDAAKSAGLHGSFIGMAEDGHIAIARTRGNPYAGILLRGGKNKPNYYPRHVKNAKNMLIKAGLIPSIGIDANHDNSNKIASEQIRIARSVSRQIALGEAAITSFMVESNLRHGKQNVGPRDTLEYGISVTDECIGIDETRIILDILAKAVRKRRERTHNFSLRA